MMKAVKYPALEEFLVTHTDFYRVALGTVFFEPGAYEWHIADPTGSSSPLIERSWGPVKVDAGGSILGVERLLGHHGLETIRQFELFEIQVTGAILVELFFECLKFLVLVCWHRVDDLVVVEHWNLRIVPLDKAYCRVMVRRECHSARTTIVELTEGYLVLGSNWVSDNDLVYVIKFVPIFIFFIQVTV